MFANVTFYRVDPAFEPSADLLSRMPAKAPLPQERRTSGFIDPCAHASDGLVHKILGGAISQNEKVSKIYGDLSLSRVFLICLETCEKLLPAAYLREKGEEKITKIYAKEARTVGAKEARQIREEIYESLLPQAFTQKKRIYAAFCNGFLMVGTSSNKQADEMINKLISVFNFAPRLIKISETPKIMMLDWLAKGAPEGLSLDDFVELERVENGEISIFKKTDLNDVYKKHCENGMFNVKKMAMTFGGFLSFKLRESLVFNSVKDESNEPLEGEEEDNREEKINADAFLLITGLVNAFSLLLTHFKEQKPEDDLLSDDKIILSAIENKEIAKLASDIFKGAEK